MRGVERKWGGEGGWQLEEKVLHASEKLEQNLLASKHKMEL